MLNLSKPDGLVALVLAAGLSRRFAGDKLLAHYLGKPLAAHIADVLVGMDIKHLLAVCPSHHEERASLVRDRGFEIVWNDAPDQGMGHSLALGAGRARALAAGTLLLCLADMPKISAAHLGRIVAMGRDGVAVATLANGVRMPPALFPQSMLPELARLTGDRGAPALLAGALTVEAEAEAVRDLDTRSDFD